MLVVHDLDTGGLYESKRLELVELARGLPLVDLDRLVPATPGWTVHDVVAHVVGITADLNAQRFGSGDADEWTAAQVRARRDRTLDELVEEWDREATVFEDGLRLFGYELGSHYVADLLQHTADIHHAVGSGRIADDDALTAALDFYVDYLHQTLRDRQVGSVELVLPDESVVVGVGPTRARLAADRLEIFRTLGGRRSEQQIRALTWTGDVDGMAPLIAAYPMPLVDIVE